MKEEVVRKSPMPWWAAGLLGESGYLGCRCSSCCGVSMPIRRAALRRQTVRFGRGQFDGLQRPMSAARASFDINTRQGEHPLGGGFGRLGLGLGNSESSAALSEHRCFASAGQEAEVADPHESRRQHVQAESPDELRGGQ